jgi:choline/carnitine/betaine transport
MNLKPPVTELDIATSDSGFYKGFNTYVTISGKMIVVAFVLWILLFPTSSLAILDSIKNPLMAASGPWYIIVMAIFVIVCLGLAIWPTTGKMVLGTLGEKPEFSFFSWVAMMFSAGLGIGMLTYATAEPLYHLQDNPDVIQGLTNSVNADNLAATYKWTFFHYGITAWASYAIVGMALAFFSFRRGLPLTLRTGITAIFGGRLSGTIGNIIDIAAIVATIIGVAVSLSIGIGQFASGVAGVTGASWMLNEDGSAVPSVIIMSTVIIIGLSTISALSGVGKGIKWLSNINMILSFFILIFFLVMGSTLFSMEMMFVGLFEYLKEFPALMFTIWEPVIDAATGEVIKDSVSAKLAGWQSGWSIFYWAWWVAFAPFVGMFIARISRGRSIREFVLGVIIAPSLVCFLWFAIVGGTAIDMELNGTANGSIMGAPLTSQLYASLEALLSPTGALVMTGVVVILLLTYLVTTVDSSILVINTINAAGNPTNKHPIHIIIWGIGIGLLMISLLIFGGSDTGGAGGSVAALKPAMLIGAFPFSIVMFLMCIALIKAAIRDGIREKNGEATTYTPDGRALIDPDLK